MFRKTVFKKEEITTQKFLRINHIMCVKNLIKIPIGFDRIPSTKNGTHSNHSNWIWMAIIMSNFEMYYTDSNVSYDNHIAWCKRLKKILRINHITYVKNPVRIFTGFEHILIIERECVLAIQAPDWAWMAIIMSNFET